MQSPPIGPPAGTPLHYASSQSFFSGSDFHRQRLEPQRECHQKPWAILQRQRRPGTAGECSSSHLLFSHTGVFSPLLAGEPWFRSPRRGGANPRRLIICRRLRQCSDPSLTIASHSSIGGSAPALLSVRRATASLRRCRLETTPAVLAARILDRRIPSCLVCYSGHSPNFDDPETLICGGKLSIVVVRSNGSTSEVGCGEG